jgi:SAM-dependent methyltransferase
VSVPADQASRREAIFRHTMRWLQESLPRPLSPAWTLLEVGAGLRGFANLYAEHVRKVIALDLVDYSDRNPGIEYVVADLTKSVPIPDESVDIAVSHSVLEHVDGSEAALRNISRMVRQGGYIYITVAPLYYSAQGAHMRFDGIDNWEHLDPDRPFFMTSNPLPDAASGGHFLNQMTWSDVLAAVGQLPWEIVRTRLMFDDQPLPPWTSAVGVSEMDLRCRGFFLLAQKMRRF